MKKNIFCSLIFFVSIILFPSFAFSQTDFPSLEPYIEFDFPSETLTSKQIITAALCFSEYPMVDNSKYLSLYEKLEERLKTKYFKSLTQKEQAQEILLLMYEKTLLQYELRQTKLTTVFDQGTYNCVSASVLYMALAKAAGLKVVGNRAPDHCFCTVIIDGQKIDVETTNPMGFNPGEKKIISQNGNGTKYATVPKRAYDNRWEVSDKMMVSLVGRNVTSFSMDKKDFKTAIPVAATRLYFLKDEIENPRNDGRNDFDVACSNYAAYLQQQKKYLESLSWLDLVVSRWGMSDGLKKNYSDAIYNGVLFLSENGKSSSSQMIEAKENLQSHKIFLSQKDFDELTTIILINETSAQLEKISTDEKKLELIREKKKNQSLSKLSYSQLDVFIENIWIKKINQSLKENDFLSAASLCDSALKDLPDNSQIKKIRQVSLNNYAVTVHNQFAELANKGKYNEARKVLEDGLKILPNNATLKNDLKKLGNR